MRRLAEWPRPIAVLALLASLAGCGTDRVARELDTAIGRMTTAEAEVRFGIPTRIMKVGSQETWSYEETVVIGSVPEPSSLDEPGPFVGRAVRRQILLFFDTRGVLSRWQRL